METYSDRGAAPAEVGREMSLAEGLVWVIARWKWLVIPGLLLLVLTVLPLVLRPTLYTATVSFIPEGGGSASSPAENLGGGAAALAGLFGGGPRPSEVLVEVVSSRAVLDRLSREEFDVEGTRRPLYEILGHVEEPPAEARSRAVNELQDLIQTETSRTGVVEVSVTTFSPDLSRALAHQLLEEMDEWERQRRVHRASLERDFMQERLEAADADLREAENELRDWLQQNREFESAQKRFEYERLQRRVSLKQDFYLTLASRHENVRMASLRDLTSIAVLDEPPEWLPPDKKPYLFRAVVGFVLGATLGLVLALVRESVPAGWRSWSGFKRLFFTDRAA